MNNLKLGALGESIAKKFLEDKGYKIIEQNCRNRYGEIDLVAKNKGDLVFVEVKTRIGERFGTPEDALNKNKIHRLVQNAQAYIVKRKYNMVKYRIDAICIVVDKNQQLKRLNHYENII